MTKEEVATFLFCEICLREFGPNLRRCVDHCHTTGKVRGILCDDCNISLGKMADDPERLKRAAVYLEQVSLRSV